jgi:adenylosuccinate lyase
MPDTPPLPTTYDNPLTGRYASAEMSRIFSPAYKFTTWRRLWLALAESERELGLDISDAALADMRAHLEDIDLARAAEIERRVRHDVMAHVRHFGEVAHGGGGDHPPGGHQRLRHRQHRAAAAP